MNEKITLADFHLKQILHGSSDINPEMGNNPNACAVIRTAIKVRVGG